MPEEGDYMTYDNTFRIEAVKLSDEVGVKKAAEQLGIPYYTLTTWRYKRNTLGDQAYIGSGHKRLPADAKERRILELEKENAELQRANEVLKEALGFFAQSRKK